MMARVSILGYQYSKHQEHTGVETLIICISSFMWIHDIQSFEKLFRWKLFSNGTSNLICKYDNASPWNKVTGFPFDGMSSPHQFKLDQCISTSICTLGSDIISSCGLASRVFSSCIFFDSNCTYLEDN